MTDQELTIFQDIQQSLRIIAGALAKAPNMQKAIADYPAFNWESIGARVLRSDSDGASVVEHNGKIYKRRSPDNKFEACIWFSRCTGKDASGNNEYECLVSFETIKDDVEPLGQKARKTLQSQTDRTIPSHALTADRQPPATKPDNVSPFTAKPLTDKEMRFRAERIAAENRVTFDATSKTYTVQVNDKISYQVKPGPTCGCERFSAAVESNFRCEHIRAVALFTSQSTQPGQRNQLQLLIADLKAAGIGDSEIEQAIARVCDGACAVADLTTEQLPKALRTLQAKYTDLAVRQKAAA